MRTGNRILLLTVAVTMVAAAQSDPSGRVGRLNFVSGAVSFQPAGVEDWVNADPNRPLTTGDRLWVDNDSRAELHIGSAALRMYSRTAFEFLNLDDSNVQIRLTQGTLSVRVRRLDDRDTFEVDTPVLAFSLLRTGDYRIDVNPDTGETVIFVRSGQGDVTGGGQPYTVHPGEQARVHADQTYQLVGVPPPDGWDSWCIDRDAREDRSQSAKYVSRDMVGWQDLDNNGAWRTVPDYGSVWVPRSVASDWAPYHNGHWAWIEPWGWTWVDDAPWGFAPFHYGRWVNVGYWAWVPGPVAVRPVYAPALVAWVGGSGFGVGVSFGGGPGIGWFALGPRDVYAPAYGASPAYLTRVNTSNTVITNINVTNIYNTTNVRYVNQSVPGAVTAIPQSAMSGARPVQQVAVRVDARQVQAGQVMTAAPVAPQRAAVLGRPEGSGGRVLQPPAAALTKPVVAKIAPPPAPVPFAQRQQELAKNPGHPLDVQSVQRLRAQAPVPARAVVKAPVAAPSAAAPSGGPTRRADTPATTPASPATPPARAFPAAREAQPAQQQPKIQPPPARAEQPVAPPARREAAEPARPSSPPAATQRQAQPEKRPEHAPEKGGEKKDNKKDTKKEEEKRKE